MKYIKTYESVNSVACDKCGWKWNTEKDDDRKYLCHKCGYDNELKKYDMESLDKWKKNNPEVSLPFQETKLSDNTFIRKFSQDTDSGEFMWHRDREDRIIESISETDWMIQIDNELPRKIEGKVEIPMGVYHRLIKGSGNLKIKLIKKIL